MKQKNKFLFFSLLAVVAFSTSCSNSKNGGDSSVSPNPVTPETVTITWNNYDGTTLKTDTVPYGTTPEYKGETPTHPSDSYVYTFDGWSPEINIATQDQVYVAKYKCDVAKYKITFDANGGKFADGTSKKETTYDYGVFPTIPENPSKDGCTFASWDSTVSVVTREKTYTANYKSVQKTISVNCLDNSCSVNGKYSFTTLANVGDSITYHFALTSSTKYNDYPVNIEFKEDGIDSNNYAYDNTTGNLTFTVNKNISITAKADDYAVKMIYQHNSSASEDQVGFYCEESALLKVDWGDGTTEDEHNISHSYAGKEDKNYVIKIYGSDDFYFIWLLGEDFSGDKHITDVYLSNKIKSIVDTNFSSCESLKSIIIPKSVTSSIGYGAFQYCTSLESVIIPNTVTSIDDSAFYDCSSLKSITIPGSVTTIGPNAFYSCDSLSSVKIYSGVTTISEFAFRDCTALSSISFPNTLTSIGSNAFMSCESLNSITIPSSVNSIGVNAFAYCSNLNNVDMTDYSEDNVPTLGSSAFNNCSSSLKIHVKDVATRTAFREKWKNRDIQPEQIVCPAANVSLVSSCYTLLNTEKEVDYQLEYTNTLVKNTGIEYFPTTYCFSIKVGSKELTKGTDYSYDESTGEFTINSGIIDNNITITAKALNDFSWSEIQKISQEDKLASSYFHVGDTKDVLVNGNNHRARIIGFNQDVDESNNSIGITFEFADLISDENGYSIAAYWNDTNDTHTSNYNYKESTIRAVLNGNDYDGSSKAEINWFQYFGPSEDTPVTGKNRLYSTDYSGKSIIDMLPNDLTSVLKTTSKFININPSGSGFEEQTVLDKIFILSPREMGREGSEQQEPSTFTYTFYEGHTGQTESIRIKYQLKWHDGARTELFKGSDIDGKYTGGDKYSYAGYNTDSVNGGGMPWLRSPAVSSTSTNVSGVSGSGMVGYANPYNRARPVAPAFCI